MGVKMLQIHDKRAFLFHMREQMSLFYALVQQTLHLPCFASRAWQINSKFSVGNAARGDWRLLIGRVCWKLRKLFPSLESSCINPFDAAQQTRGAQPPVALMRCEKSSAAACGMCIIYYEELSVA